MQPCQSRAATSVDAGERLLQFITKIRGTLAFTATGGALLKENEQNKRNQPLAEGRLRLSALLVFSLSPWSTKGIAFGFLQSWDILVQVFD